MSTYEELVRRAADLRDGKPLYNGSLDHASVLAEAIFAHAMDHVNIFTGELNPRVYGTSALIDNAKTMLAKRGCTVQILLENAERIEPMDHPFVVEFAGRADVRYRVLPKEMLHKIPYHFIEMDGDSYRFEKDKLKPEAVAAFGDKQGASRLNGIFARLWEISYPPEWAQTPRSEQMVS